MDHMELVGALVLCKVIDPAIGSQLASYARAFGWLPQFGTNGAANIRRIEKRIEELLAKAAQPERDPIRGDGYTIEWNKDDNRVQIFFPFRPSDEVVERLKSRGFRWARSIAAWQRHASEGAWYQAKWCVGHTDGKPAVSEPTEQAPDAEAQCACQRGGHCDVAHTACSCATCNASQEGG